MPDIFRCADARRGRWAGLRLTWASRARSVTVHRPRGSVTRAVAFGAAGRRNAARCNVTEADGGAGVTLGIPAGVGQRQRRSDLAHTLMGKPGAVGKPTLQYAPPRPDAMSATWESPLRDG